MQLVVEAPRRCNRDGNDGAKSKGDVQMIKQSKYYYMSKETGELLTWDEMLTQAAEWYDIGDDTNACGLDDYYEMTGCEI